MGDMQTTIVVASVVGGFFGLTAVISFVVVMVYSTDPRCCAGCSCYMERRHLADPELVESAQEIRARADSVAKRTVSTDTVIRSRNSTLVGEVGDLQGDQDGSCRDSFTGDGVRCASPCSW